MKAIKFTSSSNYGYSDTSGSSKISISILVISNAIPLFYSKYFLHEFVKSLHQKSVRVHLRGFFLVSFLKILSYTLIV